MRAFSVLLIALSLVAMPFAGQAAETCRCYCGTEADGAQAQTGDMERTACIEKCAGSNTEFVGCYDEASQYPRFNDMCWTNDECMANEAVSYGSYRWVDAVPYCEDTPDKTGYCYAPPRPVSLMVDLGSVTEASSIAGYVDALYRLLVPAMTLVAIVMLMIAGLQYILARGNADGIKKSKERMTKAVVGLVLLLSAYTIARLLDPSLVDIKQLRTPMLKEVTILEGNSCESLASAGYEIDNKSGSAVTKNCGETGTVTAISSVSNAAWEVDDTCMYSTCSKGRRCVGNGTTYSCLACADIYTDVVDTGTASVAGVTPSDTVCSALTTPYADLNAGDDKYICQYIEWGPYKVCGQVSDKWTAGTSASSSGVNLNCQALRSQTNGGSCRSYDNIYINFHTFDAMASLAPDTVRDWLTRDTTWEIDIFAAANDDAKELFTSLCTGDPCGLKPGGGTCQVRQVGNHYDCISSLDTLLVETTGEITGGTCRGRRAGTDGTPSIVECAE